MLPTRLRSRVPICLSAFALLAASPALASTARHHHRPSAHRTHGMHRVGRQLARGHVTYMVSASSTTVCPKVTAMTASNVTATTAQANGQIDPQGRSTSYSFQWGTSTSYGHSTSLQSAGSGLVYTPVSTVVSSLTSSTTYHYRIVAKNSACTSYGSDTAVATKAQSTTAAPTVTTGAASAVTQTGATFNGAVNPNGSATSVSYQYGPTSSYGSQSAAQSAGSGTNAVTEALSVTGLQAQSTYHFRIVASNAAGTSYGSDQTLTTTSASAPPPSTYDQTVLSDHPAAFWDMTGASTETDLTGFGHTGTYKGGTPALATLPNGEHAADFNTSGTHSGQYLTVPSSSAFSIPSTHQLTWEAWIRPDVLQFAHAANADQYVDWMGKCQNYSPSCEWEARFYSLSTPQGRPDRSSAYVFNPSAGLGSAADWQPATGVVSAGKWLYVVGEYQTLTTPSACSTAYPGTINIWVNGIEQNFASHKPTGCMSQYPIIPTAGSSSLDVGTMALDSWWQGAVGKVAIYDGLLSPAQISAHYTAMTGLAPSGSCAATCTIP